MIKFQCGNCSKSISVQDNYAGKKGKCPKCQTIVIVPEKEEDFVFDDVLTLEPLSKNQNSKQSTKICPFCEETIFANAQKCKHCGEFLNGQNRQNNKQKAGDSVVMRLVLPVGRSGWAIASGYFALLSILIIPAPLALITGIIACISIKRNPDKHGMGRAVFGIIVGALFTAAYVIALFSYFNETSYKSLELK